jgi:DNA gyrase subunit A
VNSSDQVIVITSGGQLIRTRTDEIRECGRNTQGVRIIRLDPGERVVDVAPVADYDDGGGPNGAGNSQLPPSLPPEEGLV